MRKSNTQNITDILNECFKDLNIDKRLKEVKLINSWESTVGKTVARYTTNIYIDNKKLFIVLNSSIVRNELLMIKDALIDRLNSEAGENIINEIVIR